MLNEFGDDVILRYGKFQSTVGVEDVKRIPQGKLMKAFPGIMEFIANLNKAAIARSLFDKTIVPWKNLRLNKRNHREITDEVFSNIILPGLREKGFTAWVYFYYYGPDMCTQMEYQIELFRKATFPVYMLQGARDKGQVSFKFDSSVYANKDTLPGCTFHTYTPFPLYTFPTYTPFTIYTFHTMHLSHLYYFIPIPSFHPSIPPSLHTHHPITCYSPLFYSTALQV